ncbi:MAG: metallophosphoesterase family protein [Conexivisphaerales archaeon]
MKPFIISGIHSNIYALQKVFNSTSSEEVMFLGDLVDFGPCQYEVWRVLQQLDTKRVLGNHDFAASFGTDCRSSPCTHEASMLTKRLITLQYMPREVLGLLGKAERHLNIEYDGIKIYGVHASPDDELYGYLSKEEAVSIPTGQEDLILLGDAHIPYEAKEGKKWIINACSVGIPRDGNSKASCTILDTAKREARLHRFRYDIERMLHGLKSRLSADEKTYIFIGYVS